MAQWQRAFGESPCAGHGRTTRRCFFLMDISSSVIEPVALENPRDEHLEKQDDPYKAFDFVHFLPFTYLVPRGMIDMQGPEKFCFVQPTHGGFVMSVYDDLTFAIDNRRVVKFTYDGHHRVVEPFLLGVTTAGKPALRGYQTAGTSNSGTVPAWHLFSLSKISAIEVTQSCFEGVRPFYNPADKAMLRIDAHV